MAKENICGKAFEELTTDEMVEFEGGATLTTTCCVTSAPSLVASVIASVIASIVVTVK